MTAPPIATPLVSTQWLADHLGADRLVIVDATVLPFTQPNGRTAYLSGHESYLMNGHLPGAVFADLMMQSLGLAAWPAVLLLIAFGLATAIGDALQHRLQPTAFKIFCSVSGVLLLSAALSALAAPARWPLAAGLGGLWGDGLYPYPLLPDYPAYGLDMAERERAEQDYSRLERARHRSGRRGGRADQGRGPCHRPRQGL